MTPLTEALIRDHREIDALLADAITSDGVDRVAFSQFRARLLRHIAIEEKLLLTAARRARGAPIGRARRLRVEHAAITSLLVPTPDRALVDELARLLETHDALEEGPDGVYAECEAAIGDRWLDILALVRAYPAVRVAAHFDRAGAPRTAAAALARAERMPPTRGVTTDAKPEGRR